jgi:hypothetical protein
MLNYEYASEAGKSKLLMTLCINVEWIDLEVWKVWKDW